MKILKFEDRESWEEARAGKITGSKLGDITLKRGGGYKKGFYELIAEEVAIPDEEDIPTNVMDRGTYLEPRCLDKFIAETGKEVDTSLLMWVREDNEKIAVSPDGVIGKTEAVECKSLNSASHIEAWLTKKIPSEYDEQVLQYFVVNDKLEKLYFCFYDPRIISKDFFYFVVNRKDIEEKITETLEYEKNILSEIEKIVLELTF